MSSRVPVAPAPAPRRSGPVALLRRSGFGRIAGISASLVSTQAFTSVLGLVFWALAARQFGTAEVGVAGAAIALMLLLGSLGTLGLGTVLISRLPGTAAGERRVLIRTCLAASAAGGALLGLVVPFFAVHVVGASALAPIAGDPGLLLLFAVGTALTSVVIVLDQAVLTVGIGALQLERNITASATKIVALLALGFAGVEGGMTVFAAWAIGNLVSLPLVAWRTRGGRALATDTALLRPTLLRGIGRMAVSHHALNVSIQAALQLLPVLVLLLISANANASFNAAIMFAGFVFALPYAVSVGLFAAARGDESEVVKRMRLTIPFGLAVSAAAVVVLLPLAGPLLHIFGPQYAAAGTPILQLVVLAGIPFVIKDHFIALRRVQGRTTQALVMTSIFLVLELAGAAVGAQLGGVAGLCIGWVSVLVVEAVVLGVPLIAALRGSAAPRTATGTLDTSATDVPTGSPEAAALTTAGSTATAASTTAAEPLAPAETADPDIGGTAPRRPSSSPAGGRLGSLLRRNLSGPTLLVMSLGVLLMATAANAGRDDDTGLGSQLLWVAGLVVVFVPAAFRVVLRSTPGVERVVLAIGLGMMLQFSRLVLNPTIFAFHDELIHAETLQQIDDSGHLFSPNPLLPVSAYYPGLEIVTNALQRLTGLNDFVSAAITLGLARAIMVLTVIALVRLLSGSYRAGAVGAVVYLANPQLLFFNSQYSYQTLALPLALLTVYLFASRRRGSLRSLLPALIAAVATVFTHHLTAAFLICFFAVWLAFVRRRPSSSASADGSALHPLATIDLVGDGRGRWIEARDLAILTIFSYGLLVVSVLLPGNPLGGYLGSIASSSTTDVADLAQGHQTKALFADSAGSGPAPWEQILLILAVLITMASLLATLRFLRVNWKAARPLAVLIGVLAIAYPIVPGGHLTAATAEVGDRASGFVFIGIAVVLGMWWWIRTRGARAIAVFVVGATVVFLGNIVLGAGPTASQLPGPYEISADARSVDADTLAAARWMDRNLPHGSVTYGDRTMGMLAAAYGSQDAVLHVSTGYDASRLLLAPTVTGDDIALIRATKLDYLIVDQRLSTGLPHQQFYIESGEFGGDDRKKPVSREALTKFSGLAGVDRIYDNGSVVIYDVRGLR